MPPASLEGVVDSTEGFTDWRLEMFPWHVLESQFQAFRFSLEATFGHSPLPTQSQCCGKSSSGVILLIQSTVISKSKSSPPVGFPNTGPSAFAG